MGERRFRASSSLEHFASQMEDDGDQMQVQAWYESEISLILRLPKRKCSKSAVL